MTAIIYAALTFGTPVVWVGLALIQSHTLNPSAFVDIR